MKLRSRLVLLLGILSVLLLLVTPVFAKQTDPPTGISDGQLVIIGLVASAALWVLRMIVKAGYSPSKEIVAIALYVLAFFLAVWFTPINYPPFDPFNDAATFIASLLSWIGGVLAVASPVAGFAYLIYNVLLQRVLEAFKSKVIGTN